MERAIGRRGLLDVGAGPAGYPALRTSRLLD